MFRTRGDHNQNIKKTNVMFLIIHLILCPKCTKIKLHLTVIIISMSISIYMVIVDYFDYNREVLSCQWIKSLSLAHTFKSI